MPFRVLLTDFFGTEGLENGPAVPFYVVKMDRGKDAMKKRMITVNAPMLACLPPVGRWGGECDGKGKRRENGKHAEGWRSGINTAGRDVQYEK